MSDASPVLYDVSERRVARITLNRPERRNAQDTRMLHALNDAMDAASRDDGVSVIVLGANGPHFSSGHDLREMDRREATAAWTPITSWSGFEAPGAAGRVAREYEMYLSLSERWRNISKPTIAEVHGKVIAGGLMLVWPCDLVVASEDAEFIDNTLAMGVSGTEYFGLPWEVGPRKAKELLFTSGALSARRAYELGMVNHVVSKTDLTDFTMSLARDIATKPLFALRLAKEAVNFAQDSQGRPAAMRFAFALHQLCHSHNMQVHGAPIDPEFSATQFGRAVTPR